MELTDREVLARSRDRRAEAPGILEELDLMRAWTEFGKEARERQAGLECLSIDLYRAVVRDWVRRPKELRAWLSNNEVGMLSDWQPGEAG